MTASRVSMTLGSTTRLNEFDFAKISVSLERDLVPAENPIDAYRDIKALLERMVTEFQGSKPGPSQPGPAATAKTQQNSHETPRVPASKLETLRERLSPRLQDLEITDGIDGLVVKPRKYLGESWSEVNEVIRALGGRWFKGAKPTDGTWRIPK
jgi:hypothetical protein